MKLTLCFMVLVGALGAAGATRQALRGNQDERHLPPAPKVEICHIPPGNPANFHTISVSDNAVPAHLAHGDLVGPCDEHCDTLCDDGDECTLDLCDDDGCTEPRPPLDCDDLVACTDDSCDPTSGCVHVDNCVQGACDMSTGQCDLCAGVDCDDDIACTDDTCDPATGTCSSVDNCPSGMECDMVPGAGVCVSTNPCLGVLCPTDWSCDPADVTCKPNTELRPCIAVIDESDTANNATVDQRWADFRNDYPDRPFCLLQPQIPNTGYNLLHRPAAFNSDPKTTFAIVNRDNGNAGLASDWLGICGITAATGIDFVALFVDISGSMVAQTVAASRAKFEADLALLGLAFCDVENGYEDWITPFDADMSTYDPVTGLCSGS